MAYTKMEFTTTAKCPDDDTSIGFRVTVSRRRFLNVHDLLEMVRAITEKPIYQEDFTKALYDRLAAGDDALHDHVMVVTVGVHEGVEITCEA